MRTYLRLLGYLRAHRLRFTAALACMVVYALMSALALGTISPFMQVLFERASQTTATTQASATVSPAMLERAGHPLRADNLTEWPGILEARARRSLFAVPPRVALERICIFILVVLLLKNLADYAQNFLMVWVEQAAVHDLRAALLSHLQRLSLSFYHARRTGSLMARVTSDVEYLREALATGISRVVKGTLTLAGCLAWAFYASWRLTLLSMLILPPMLLALTALGRKLRRRSGLAQDRMGDMAAMLQENIAGARVVRAFGREDFEREKFEKANRDYFRAFVRMRRVATASGPLGEFGMVLAAVAMLWLGGIEIFTTHTLQPHQFILFVTALVSMSSPIRGLSEVNAGIQQGLAAARRIFALLDTVPDVTDRPAARD
jgi:subfamily B ATP-binding cassette protein MsbA